MKMNKYDYDIRNTFDNIVGKDMFFNLDNAISDYDLIRLATELIRFEKDRLASDLSYDKIYEEYIRLDVIIKQLENIIENYK